MAAILAVRVKKRPGEVSTGDTASVTVTVSPRARCTIGVLLLDHVLSCRRTRSKARDEDHLDVAGRFQHEAGDVASEDRLRNVGQGSDERPCPSLNPSDSTNHAPDARARLEVAQNVRCDSLFMENPWFDRALAQVTFTLR